MLSLVSLNIVWVEVLSTSKWLVRVNVVVVTVLYHTGEGLVKLHAVRERVNVVIVTILYHTCESLVKL